MACAQCEHGARAKPVKEDGEDPRKVPDVVLEGPEATVIDALDKVLKLLDWLEPGDVNKVLAAAKAFHREGGA